AFAMAGVAAVAMQFVIARPAVELVVPRLAPGLVVAVAAVDGVVAGAAVDGVVTFPGLDRVVAAIGQHDVVLLPLARQDGVVVVDAVAFRVALVIVVDQIRLVAALDQAVTLRLVVPAVPTVPAVKKNERHGPVP